MQGIAYQARAYAYLAFHGVDIRFGEDLLSEIVL